MRKVGPGLPQGGTYAAHPVSIAAAAKTLEILQHTDALERVAAYGTRLQKGIGAILERKGIPHSFVGHPSMGGIVLDSKPPRSVREWRLSDYKFYNAMAARLNDLGILCEPDSWEPWFISAAHDDACLTETLEKFAVAVDQTLAERERAPRSA
jgi:glutamate-1-semialdehyde 2,1-aminomutase